MWRHGRVAQNTVRHGRRSHAAIDDANSLVLEGLGLLQTLLSSYLAFLRAEPLHGPGSGLLARSTQLGKQPADLQTLTLRVVGG
jgi:hypothetical protein